MDQWNIVGNEKRIVFKIPIGKMDIEKAEKTLKEMISKYKEPFIIDFDGNLPMSKNENYITQDVDTYNYSIWDKIKKFI